MVWSDSFHGLANDARGGPSLSGLPAAVGFMAPGRGQNVVFLSAIVISSSCEISVVFRPQPGAAVDRTRRDPRGKVRSVEFNFHRQ
jgi:hypothetical protein